MDVLSEVLQTVRLKGGVFLDARLTPPWSVTAELTAEDCLAFMPKPEVLCSLHYVISGEMFVEVNGEAAIPVKGGELILLPHNDRHTLSSLPGQRSVSTRELMQKGPDGGMARIVHGGKGDKVTHILCGFLASEKRRNPLLSTLPRLLKVDISEGASRDWIESSLRYGAHQLSEGKLASSSIMARLSELLFVEAVRAYSDSLLAHEKHWLRGLKDRYVGRALAALHNRLSHSWTVDELAAEVGLSRSAFVVRFTSAVGTPPMQYLTQSRMQLAKELLLERQKPIGQVALAVGYEAEAAFNRAFKREFGIPPAKWRKNI